MAKPADHRWTAAAMETIFLPQYVFWSVNNQYRGRTQPISKPELDSLLQMAIQFAGGNRYMFLCWVFHWGVTPFAKRQEDKNKIEWSDAFNAVCKTAAEASSCHSLILRKSQRADGNDPAFTCRWITLQSRIQKWAEKLSVAVLKTRRLIGKTISCRQFRKSDYLKESNEAISAWYSSAICLASLLVSSPSLA